MDLKALYETEAARAYAFALRFTRNPAEAEDAVAEAFCRLVEGRAAASDRPGLMALVWRAVFVARRSERARHRREEGYAVERGKEQAGRTPAGEAEAAELVGAARSALGALSTEERAVVSLSCEHGLGPEDIARIVELPVETVRSHRRRGLERLRALLATAGFAAAAPAGIEAVLASAPAEALPAGLATKISRLLGAKAAVPAVAAAKGGIAMKVVAGVVLAGALAGVVAMSVGPATGNRQPATNLASPPAASGPVKVEPYAFATGRGHLDGPKLQAMAADHKFGVCDEDGNLIFMSAFGPTALLRCIRVDGAVETIACDTFWHVGPLDEGPASFMPLPQMNNSIGGSRACLVAKGRPYAGEDKGCIYVGDGCKPVYRIFKNKAKGDRWWFKVVTAGKDAPPAEVGKSAKLSAVTLDGAMFAPNGVTLKGSFYEIDEASDKITCLLTPADYQDKTPNKKATQHHIGRFEDGSFAVWFYDQDGSGIFRVSADRSKVELICKDNPGKFDGPGAQMGLHTGPHLGPIIKNTFFIGAIDGSHIRRWHEGRASTLCLADGEWHEYAAGKDVPRQQMLGRNATIPPNGGCSYLLYPGEVMSQSPQTYKIYPIDWTKPTIGPKVGGE